jgi:O-antigen/teichoic acid export membrane protein
MYLSKNSWTRSSDLLVIVDGSASQNRDRALKRAVSTGILSKGGALSLQLLAMPFAIRQLGLDGFGQYALAVALFSWAGLVEGLVGQSVIRKLVVSVKQGDADAVSSIVFTAVVVIISCIVAVTAAVLLLLVGASMFVPRASSVWDWRLLSAAAVIAGLRVVFAIGSKVRAALQQLHIENSLAAVANVVAATLVVATLSYKPTPLALLLSVSLPVLAAQCLSGWLVYKNNSLLQAPMHFNNEIAREITKEGGWLTLGQIGLLMERQLPVILLAGWGLVQYSGQYAVAVQIIMMSAAPLLMFTIPFMPSTADSIAAGQHDWWKKRLALVHSATITASATGVMVAALCGPELLSLVFGQGQFLSRGACVALALWISAILAANCYYAVMIAAGKMRKVGLTMLTEGVLFLLFAAPAFLWFRFTGVFLVGSALAVVCMYNPWRITCSRLGAR